MTEPRQLQGPIVPPVPLELEELLAPPPLPPEPPEPTDADDAAAALPLVVSSDELQASIATQKGRIDTRRGMVTDIVHPMARIVEATLLDVKRDQSR